MTPPEEADFQEPAQQFIGSTYGAGAYGSGVYGGEQILNGDMELPQSTNWTEEDE